MIRRLNKKGVATFYTIMFAFVKFIIVMLVLFSLIGLINQFIFFDNDTTGLEAEIFANSVMRTRYGPSLYDNETERLYPFFIDMDFFENYNGQLKKAINYSEDFIAAEITIYNDEFKPVFDGKTIPAVYYNEKKYKVWKEISKMDIRSGATGPGDVADFKKKYYVNIKNGERITPGFIQIDIMFLKS